MSRVSDHHKLKGGRGKKNRATVVRAGGAEQVLPGAAAVGDAGGAPIAHWIQYDSAEWKPAFLRQAREFLFFPLLPREASK